MAPVTVINVTKRRTLVGAERVRMTTIMTFWVNEQFPKWGGTSPPSNIMMLLTWFLWLEQPQYELRIAHLVTSQARRL